MKAKVYIDTHHVWFNPTTRATSRHIPCTLTGRIKYLDYGKPRKVEMMVEATFESVRQVPKERRWDRQKMETYEITKWVKDSDLHIEILPEETIYECTSTSTVYRDTCCEDHW